MKRVILLLFFQFIIFSCKNTELTKQEKAKLIAIGDSSAMVLVKALGGALKGALSSGGAVKGIEFCSKNAQTLTESVEKGLPEGIKVKRTSMKYRNENNKPDNYDKEALLYYQKNWSNGSKNISPYIQYVPEEDGYRYYKPLSIKQVCLNCHGDRQEINPEVRMRLKKYYSDDRAIGYKTGDFRGVVRVLISKKIIKK